MASKVLSEMKKKISMKVKVQSESNFQNDFFFDRIYSFHLELNCIRIVL